MRETKGNLWDFVADATVITTNGYVTQSGYAVMGRGCARECCEKYPGTEYLLGSAIMDGGNHSYAFHMNNSETDIDRTIITFPVKHHWNEKADPHLIVRSAKELVAHVDRLNLKKIIMPRPGCGNGRREWSDIKPLIEPLLDNRFTVITFG